MENQVLLFIRNLAKNQALWKIKYYYLYPIRLNKNHAAFLGQLLLLYNKLYISYI